MLTHPTDEPKNFADRLAETVTYWGPLVLIAALPFAFYLQLKTPGRGQEYFLKLAGFAIFFVFLATKLFGRIGRVRIDVPWIALIAGAFFALTSAILSPAPAYAMNALLPWFAGIALF